MTKSTTPTHIPWIDILRIAACFLVVLAHSCDFFVAQFEALPSDFLAGALWGSLVRPCVPIFVMITGVLLLPVSEPMGVFYKKRMSRVLIPLIFWGIVTPLLYVAYGNIEWPRAIEDIVTMPLNFNYTTTPLWYLYMLIGLYLFMPIISPWVAGASKRDFKIFFGIWGFTMFIPYIQMFMPMLGYEGNYGNLGLFGICDWNSIGTFHYFSGFLGYVVLGHYMAKYPLGWSMGRTLALAIPLFVAGLCITYFGFISVEKNFAALEIIWYFTGINVFMMTFAVFAVMQKIRIKNPVVGSRLSSVAKLTFGVYLCHFLLVLIGYDFVYQYLNISPYLQIPIIAFIAFAMALLATWILSKLPLRKYIIG